MFVTATVALILATLLPTADRVRRRVYLTLCQSNLHDMARALHASSGGESDTIPSAYRWMPALRNARAMESSRCPSGTYTGSQAGGIFTMPSALEILPPPSVVFGELESNSAIRIFTEREGYRLPSGVQVDISTAGLFNHRRDMTPETIRRGTVVNSYFVHFDPTRNGPGQASGEITFTSEIVGVVCLNGSLDDTDSTLGRQDTEYPTGQNARGLESNVESIRVTDDLRTIKINRFHSNFPGEQMRVLTSGEISEASYGMNNRVRSRAPRLNQLLFVEYDKSVVDVDERYSDDFFGDHVQARHFGRAAYAMVDGSVHVGTPDELDPDHSPELWDP
jgi:hypothetical protein